MRGSETTRSRNTLASVATITHDLLLQFRERAMKEVPGAGKNHHRQLLRPRPGQYIAEWNNVVFLAVHNQRLFRHISQRKPANRRCDQHQLPHIQLLRGAGCNVTAEGKPGEHRLRFTEATPGEIGNGQKIFQFPRAFVEYALALAYASEIESHGGITECIHCLGERLHHLVVQRSAVQRMRVRDDCIAASVISGIGDNNLEPSGRTVDMDFLLAACSQIRNRSTMTPLTRCLSMISSTSCWST